MKGSAPWSPTKPTEGLTVCPDSQLHFICQFMQNTELFSFLANALTTQTLVLKTLCLLLKTCSTNTPLLKLVPAIFYHFFIFLPNDSPSKTMKNVFYFI